MPSEGSSRWCKQLYCQSVSLIISRVLLTPGMLPKFFRIHAPRSRMISGFPSVHQIMWKQKWKVLFIYSMYRRVRKVGKSVYCLRHICLSARNNSVPTGWMFTKFKIRGIFENLKRKLRFY